MQSTKGSEDMSTDEGGVLRQPELSLPDLAGFVSTLRRGRGAMTQEEFAGAVDVSKATIAKIEQGVPGYRPSPSVTARIADVLKLSPVERYHLDVLTGRAPESTATFRAAVSQEQAMLDAFAAEVPAAWVENWSIALANKRFRSLWPGMDEGNSLLEWWFLDGRAKEVTPNWLWEAEVQVGQLRAFAADPANHARAREILGRLSGDPTFRELWESGVVWYERPGPRRVVSAGEGELVLMDTFVVAGSSTQWGRGLYVGLPASLQ